MDIPKESYLDTSKDIKKLRNDTKERPKWNWEVLPYHEESKEKESCSRTIVEAIKVNEQQLGCKISLNIFERKLEGLL
jgi:hypothetical protein